MNRSANCHIVYSLFHNMLPSFVFSSSFSLLCASLTLVRGAYCDRWCHDVGWLVGQVRELLVNGPSEDYSYFKDEYETLPRNSLVPFSKPPRVTSNS